MYAVLFIYLNIYYTNILIHNNYGLMVRLLRFYYNKAIIFHKDCGLHWKNLNAIKYL